MNTYIRSVSAIVPRNIQTFMYYFRKITRPSLIYNHVAGVFLSIDPFVVSAWVRDAIYKEFYEVHEVRALSHLLNSDDVVVEAGAGIGLTSSLIASIARESIHVEANAVLYRSIKTNIELNNPSSNYRIINAFASNGHGNTILNIGKDFWNASEYCNSKHTEAKDVPQIDLFGLIEDIGASGMLVDIEGAEKEVFSRVVPRSIRWIILELHPNIIGPSKCSEIVENLFLQGFTLNKRLSKDRGQVVVLER
jgi:FkbM family methyltransferase